MLLQQQSLIAMSGLPGSGKSRLARALARDLQTCLLELDRIEGPLLERVDGDVLGWAVYEGLTALADQQLDTGLSVILDAVSWTNSLRATWADLAARYGASFRPVEVVCSDPALHRQRVEGRHRGERGKPPWSRVERARNEFWEAWRGAVYVVDTARPFDVVLAETLTYVKG
jgi:predicted kinase